MALTMGGPNITSAPAYAIQEAPPAYVIQAAPPAYASATAVPTAMPVAESTTVVSYVPVLSLAVEHPSAGKRCRRCGRSFEPEPKVSPASAAAFNCKQCRGLRLRDFF